MLKYIILYVSISVLPLAFKYVLQKKYKSLLKIKQENSFEELEHPKYYYEIISIEPQNKDCFAHFRERIECGEQCSLVHLKRLIKFISSAKSTISLCMYCLSLRDFRIELSKASERGVKIRIITDKEMVLNGASKIRSFRRKRIPVKTQDSQMHLMHHKFCLIDEYDEIAAKMFFGSLNLTGQGMVDNVENVVLTNDREMIQRFSEEFEILWNNFSLN